MSFYGRADTKAQWFADNYPGGRMDPNCGVLHTTEGTSWPGYNGGATAPTLTGLPDCKAQVIRWRQHFPDEMSARALRNERGGVETNTANAIQVELIGTCDPATRAAWERKGLRHGRDFIFWPEAPEWALREVAKMVADYNKRHGIKIDGPPLWAPYPKSYANGAGQRLTHAEWRGFYGWCGHQHVPENSHGDPGSLNWPRIAQLAREIVKPVPPKPDPKPQPQPVGVQVILGHMSGLHDATTDDWSHGVNPLIARGASVVTLTETRRVGIMPRITPDGWAFTRHQAEPGQSECSIMWRSSVWSPASPSYVVRLSEKRYVRQGGAQAPELWAPVQPLLHLATGKVVLVAALHLPANIQGNAKDPIEGPRPGPDPREAVTEDAIANFGRLWGEGRSRHPGAARVVGADWNLDWFKPFVQKWWDDTFPLLQASFQGRKPARGSHGHRLIDWIGLSPHFAVTGAEVLPATRVLDHKGVLVKAKLQKEKS